MHDSAWVPFSWHCVNCGNVVTGFKNKKGDIKVECNKCKTAMIRTLKNPKHVTIEVFDQEIVESAPVNIRTTTE